MRLSVYCLVVLLSLSGCQKAEAATGKRLNPWGDISETDPSDMDDIIIGTTKLTNLEEQPYRTAKGFWRSYILKCAKAYFRGDLNPRGHFIKASSQLGEKYSPDKVADSKYNTCWAEGKPGPGTGEWILFFHPELDLHFSLYNGVWASKALYYANNRIKKAEITVYNIRGNKDKTFGEPYIFCRKVVTLHDKIWPTIFFLKYTGMNKESWKKRYKKFKYQFSYKFIVIKILDVYRGTKYNDTCISQLY